MPLSIVGRFGGRGVKILLATMLASVFFPASAKTTFKQLPEESGFEKARASVYPSLVRIHVVSNQPAGGRMHKMPSSGSGAIISAAGHIVTNHHVAGNGTHFVVHLANRESVRAELVGTDPLADIAVLKIHREDLKNSDADLPVAQWGDSDKVAVGDVVYAMGSPGGLSQSITKGIISNTNLIMVKSTPVPTLDGENVGELVSWFAHDAVIFGGNSGGPLVDNNGKIIGINEIAIANLSGAIPANLARYSVQQIIRHGEVRRSWFGLELQPRLKNAVNESGVLVSTVLPGSPAEKAGLQSGDLLTHFAGQPINAEVPEHMPAVNELMYHSRVGAVNKIRFIRHGKPATASIRSVARQRKALPQQELKTWGMTAGNISREQAIKNGRDNRSGVLVGTVGVSGPVAKSAPRIVAGDIITAISDTQIENLDHLIAVTDKLLEKTSKGHTVLVTLERSGEELLSRVPLGSRKPNPAARSVRKGWLPVKTQVVTAELTALIGLENISGYRITSVNSADFKALKRGDIITAINGRPLSVNKQSSGSDFHTLLRKYPAGRSLSLAVVRNGKSESLDITLLKTPKPKSELPLYEDSLFQFKARDVNGDSEARGIAIEEVMTGGWASINGIATGDTLMAVNGVKIDNLATLERVLDRATVDRQRYVVFKIKRNQREKFIEIEPHW